MLLCRFFFHFRVAPLPCVSCRATVARPEGLGHRMDDAASIFDRYQAVRHRLPEVRFPITTTDVESLLDLAPHAGAFVFDAFGVLNVGETPIDGAAERLDQLRTAGKAIRILSNAASYNHDGATAKFQKLGMRIGAEEIVTSRDAALGSLDTRLWGCIAAPSDDLSDIPFATCRLEDDPADYDRAEGILFLSTEVWSPQRQAILRSSLLDNPRPLLIANADLAAPRDFGFSLEPGHFGHLLADEGITGIRFFGKPFPAVYDKVAASLSDIPAERIAMCGDTLHTDILGAASRGWQTVLVTRDGMFAGADASLFCDRSGIVPDWRVPRI